MSKNPGARRAIAKRVNGKSFAISLARCSPYFGIYVATRTVATTAAEINKITLKSNCITNIRKMLNTANVNKIIIGRIIIYSRK